MLTGMALMGKLDQTANQQETTILISPEYFERPAPEPEIAEEPEKKAAEVNTELPEVEPTSPTSLIGERSVQAASETPMDQGDETLPTQLTREDPDQELPNTFNSDFIDGRIDQAPGLESAEATSVPQVEAESADTIADTENGGNMEATDNETVQTANPKQVLAKSDTQVEVAKEISEEIVPPTQEEQKEAKGSEQEGEGKAIAEQETKASQNGYQTEQKKTRIIGSLNRDGTSSLDVKGTALGKYYAAISKIIEIEWQQNCLRYREHIQPGIISMQFQIAPDGKVSRIKPSDVVATSQIQVGFTIKSIRRAKLPPMNDEVKAELEDENLELIYNFHF